MMGSFAERLLAPSFRGDPSYFYFGVTTTF
jgi:hypothetical protein